MGAGERRGGGISRRLTSPKSTHRSSMADLPHAIAITSAIRPSRPEHGAGLSSSSASMKAVVSPT